MPTVRTRPDAPKDRDSSESGPGRRAVGDGRRLGSPNGLVFTHPDGTGLWPATATAKFKAIAVELELPSIGVHGLSHTAATWMIGAGISPKLVSERLGHRNVAITLALYTHVLPSHDRDAADAFGRALEAAHRPRSNVVEF